MAADQTNGKQYKIVIMRDGPYIVQGGIPLVRKSAVVSEQGEPITWKKDQTLRDSGEYDLCRCGHSHEKPFCDGTHCEVEFDGTETAPTDPTGERQVPLPSSPGLHVRRDYALCMEAGFCANRHASIEQLLANCADPNVRLQIIAMIERCPSGSYTYAFSADEESIEPDLPQQIAVTTEMTDQGPIMGPLWVTGGIPVERSDGEPLETRNRVTLCRCGLSKIKPLCDGTHRAQHVKED